MLSNTKKRVFLWFCLIVIAIIGGYRLLREDNFQSKNKSIVIDYSGLVDKTQIVRTGETIDEHLQSNIDRGTLQPFFEPYSSVLSQISTMKNSAEDNPFINVVDLFENKKTEPVWCGIFRGGQMQIFTDLEDTVRVYLQGSDPQQLFSNNYSIIRYPLEQLKPEETELNVEIYSFVNDYYNQTLTLNVKPFIIKKESFPPNLPTIDLDVLEEFFAENGTLVGANIDPNKGLILYAEEGKGETLCREPVIPGDLAVAYRAVFHSRFNDAFISLDPHKDPTKVSVNFGGYLENTRIGSVVLDSDKRFKTITCGLDPDSHKDIRSKVRGNIPDFRTSSERDLLNDFFHENTGWIGTRFWFYPESIQVETDISSQYAYISNPYFTADAERSKDDFLSPEEFEKKKKAQLPESIQANIQHLNSNYDDYAKVFLELKELKTVARLMGIATWFKSIDCDFLDLDSLLAAEIPKVNTPEDQTQLISVSLINKRTSKIAKPSDISVHYLSDRFSKKIGSVFVNQSEFLEFQKQKKINSANEYRRTLSYKECYQEPVSAILESKESLKDFSSFLSNKIAKSSSSRIRDLEKDIEYRKRELGQIVREIEQTERKLNNLNHNQAEYNRYVDIYNSKVARYEDLRKIYNNKINQYNKIGNYETRWTVEIGGGINLEPRFFSINKDSTNKAFNSFLEIAPLVGTKWKRIGTGKQELIRSSETLIPKNKVKVLSRFNLGRSKKSTKETDSGFFTYAENKELKYWQLEEKETFTARTQIRWINSKRVDESYIDSDRSRASYISIKENNIEGFHAKENEDGMIILTPVKEDTTLKPVFPPRWWD